MPPLPPNVNTPLNREQVRNMVNWIRGKIRSSSAPIWLAIGVLAIATVMVLPNYATGQWAWSQSPTLSSVKALRALRQQGISLAGWQVLEQQSIELGHKQWSVQALTLGLEENGGGAPGAESSSQTTAIEPLAHYGLTDLPSDVTDRLHNESILIFLRPQSDAKDEPLVEWIDLNGLQRWTTDQIKSVRLPITQPSAGLSDRGADQQTDQETDWGVDGVGKVATRYFRGWNQRHTYAVMQWYVWPTGGSPKISDWFWADQRMQWRKHQRMPWVGVMLMVPIKPLGDIAPIQPVVEAIAQSIQDTLVQQITPAKEPSG